MAQLLTAEASARSNGEEARKVEAAAPGWRCIWLPQHGVYLAYRDVDMEVPNVPRPSVAEADADKTIAAIRLLGDLRDLVRQWIEQNKAES